MSIFKHNFSTPEGAVLCLEDAYRAKDLDSAVFCKDFLGEAKLMIENNPNLISFNSADILSKTTEVLELAYRKEINQNGFPNMVGVKTNFIKKEIQNDSMVILTEESVFSDGEKSIQRILVSNTSNGWKFLHALDK